MTPQLGSVHGRTVCRSACAGQLRSRSQVRRTVTLGGVVTRSLIDDWAGGSGTGWSAVLARYWRRARSRVDGGRGRYTHTVSPLI